MPLPTGIGMGVARFFHNVCVCGGVEIIILRWGCRRPMQGLEPGLINAGDALGHGSTQSGLLST